MLTKKDREQRNGTSRRRQQERNNEQSNSSSNLSPELTSENESLESSSSDDENSNVTLEIDISPIPEDVLHRVEDAEALNFAKFPRVAMNGEKIIKLKREICRKSESMKIMIAYIAIAIFKNNINQNVHSRKDKRRILNAATRLVSYHTMKVTMNKILTCKQWKILFYK